MNLLGHADDRSALNYQHHEVDVARAPSKSRQILWDTVESGNPVNK
jgi:hypothetical protein